MLLHESVVEEGGFEIKPRSMFQKRQCGRVKTAGGRDTVGRRHPQVPRLLLPLLQSRGGSGGGAEAARKEKRCGAGGEEWME